MADLPILFSGPMVRALIAGTKTQTRRALKPIGSLGNGWPMYPQFINGKRTGDTSHPEFSDLTGENGGVPLYGGNTPICPGDRLWVRESFFLADAYLAEKRFTGGSYKADATSDAELRYTGWRPSIHMPRWASRLTLTVTDVRVQRLQDISAGDALAEGIQSTAFWQPKSLDDKPFDEKWWDDMTFWAHYPPLAYAELWNSLHDAASSWDANPWVTATTFAVERRNIDQAERR